jgi:hypothetical protein
MTANPQQRRQFQRKHRTATQSRNGPRPSVKLHRSYTVEEVARLRTVSRGTVRRWLKIGLAALTDRKPTLILGEDLVQFLAARRVPSQKCAPFECYCVKCRSPRKPAGDMAEYVPFTATTGNLRAICPVCECWMHKRIRYAVLETLRSTLAVTIAEARRRLGD